MTSLLKNVIKLLTVLITISYLASTAAYANQDDAKNFITVATGSVPASDDLTIKTVERQLDLIQTYCVTAGIHDKLAKGHSMLKVSQPLLGLLNDFVNIARMQCNKTDFVTLISLYALERNSGATHAASVNNLTKNPRALTAKWSAR